MIIWDSDDRSNDMTNRSKDIIAAIGLALFVLELIVMFSIL